MLAALKYLPMLNYHLQLHRFIKAYASTPFVSSSYSNITCSAAQLAAFIRCTNCTRNCYPIITLLHCKILNKIF
jgi:hypothetical protein